MVGFDVSIHVFAQPMSMSDIVKIARERCSLMLPEIWNLITGQLPNIKDIVKTEVTTATNTSRKQIWDVRKENDDLGQTNDELTTRLIKAGATTMPSNNIPGERVLEYLASQKISMEWTPIISSWKSLMILTSRSGPWALIGHIALAKWAIEAESRVHRFSPTT